MREPITDKNKYIIRQLNVSDFEYNLLMRIRTACKSNQSNKSFILERIDGVYWLREVVLELGKFERLGG